MPNISRAKAATLGLLAPAALALGMSADTSYRFLGTALTITNPTERGLLCGVAEAAIVALTIYAWATRTKGPAYLAYAAVLVQAIPAFQVSGATGGPIRVILGPVLLAVMLHLLLGLELRMSGARSNGLVAAALREWRERLTARLGIGRRGEDSAAIARSRAADRAVNLADRVDAAKRGRKRARLRAKLADAIDSARHGLAPAEAEAAEAAIVSRVVRRKSVADLATIATRHDWTATLPGQRHDTRDTDRDTDRDNTATPTATGTATTDRDTVTTLGATGHGDRDTEAPPAVAAPAPAAGVVDLMSKRQGATSRPRAADLDTDRAAVAGDTIATATAPAPSGDTASETAPSVAQMVREAMTSGVTDRDTILSRVQQYRPTATRQSVARAMQRQASKTRATDQGQYL